MTLPTTHRRSGFTLVELLVSLFIFSLAAAMVGLGTVYLARLQASVAGQQRVENYARRFMTEILTDATDASSLTVDTIGGPRNETRLTIIRPNSLVTYRYINGDGNENTIADNVIQRSEVAIGAPVTEASFVTQLVWVSRDLDLNGVLEAPFRVDPRSGSITGVVTRQPLINVRVRVGDRNPQTDSPTRRVDDLLTGRGYQSFMVDLNVTRGDRGGI